MVDFVAAHDGGQGAARDVLEYIMKARDMWKEVVEYYKKKKIVLDKVLPM